MIDYHSFSRRVTGLYRLPAVAMEAVELTNDPEVDAEALTRCLEKDPVLTARVLRVVNSSLFGLRDAVHSLNQAIALLGLRPLKLLILGFSLPDALLAKVNKDQLPWYWSTSLTRAVAARQLSQELWNDAGNEAFLAGLLQDIGLLALLGELGESFGRLFGSVIEERQDLAQAEVQAMGFDHRDLSAAMLDHWKFPRLLTSAIAIRELPARLARFKSPEAELAKILHLAELLAQLVGQRRIRVLPELLDAGELYRGMTKAKLFELVGNLQPQVDQLADVLSLELPQQHNYRQVLDEADAEWTGLVEELSQNEHEADDDPVFDELLLESQELGDAMQAFLAAGHPVEVPFPSEDEPPGQTDPQASAGKGSPAQETDSLTELVIRAARSCRMQRAELSLVIVEVDGYEQLLGSAGRSVADQLVRILSAHCRYLAPRGTEPLHAPNHRFAMVAPGCDRLAGIRMVQEIFGQMKSYAEQSDDRELLRPVTYSAAVATAAGIFKNFTTDTLIESAQGCLGGARAAASTCVKSIEV